MRFEWDPPKAAANLRTHGVSFAEAVTVLEDEAAEEMRFVTLGLSSWGNLLVVVYTYRSVDVIRLVSAWRANRRQRIQYEESRS